MEHLSQDAALFAAIRLLIISLLIITIWATLTVTISGSILSFLIITALSAIWISLIIAALAVILTALAILIVCLFFFRCAHSPLHSLLIQTLPISSAVFFPVFCHPRFPFLPPPRLSARSDPDPVNMHFCLQIP